MTANAQRARRRCDCSVFTYPGLTSPGIRAGLFNVWWPGGRMLALLATESPFSKCLCSISVGRIRVPG